MTAVSEHEKKQSGSEKSSGHPMFALRHMPNEIMAGTSPERLDAEQGLYLTASGTLTQFNAIMAAVQTTAFSAAGSARLKGIIGTVLFLHVLAAFLLCWAARPRAPSTTTKGRPTPPLNIPKELMERAGRGDGSAMREVMNHVDLVDAKMRTSSQVMAFVEARDLVQDTAKNYRRGWRATMLAMIGSVVALAAFLAQASGIDPFSVFHFVR
jgi:hypothetical protein